MTNLIKHLWFDLNNVAEDYVSFGPQVPEILNEVCARVAGQFMIPDKYPELRSLADLYRCIDSKHPLHHYPSFWQHVLEHVLHRNLSYLEIESTYDCYLTTYTERIEAYKDFICLSSKCREQDLTFGIIANGNAKRIYRFLTKYGFEQEAATIVTSGANPFSKPAKEMFNLAITNVGIPAHMSAFIGDRIDTDIAGANNAGMWSIHLKRGNEYRKVAATSAIEIPDYSVDSLYDVLGLPIFELANETTCAVIPCGGRGTRMGPLTEDAQKCMLRPGDLPVLYRIVDLLGNCGIRDVHFLLGYRSDDVSEFFAGQKPPGVQIHYHNVRAASTGGALSSILEALPERFVYCHGNIIFEKSLLSRLIKLHCKRPDTSCFAVTSGGEVLSHPVFVVEDDIVNDVVRHPDLIPTSSVRYSLGLGVICKRNIAPSINHETGHEVTVEQLHAGSTNQIQTLEYSGPFFHLETPADLERLQRHFGGRSDG